MILIWSITIFIVSVQLYYFAQKIQFSKDMSSCNAKHISRIIFFIALAYFILGTGAFYAGLRQFEPTLTPDIYIYVRIGWNVFLSFMLAYTMRKTT